MSTSTPLKVPGFGLPLSEIPSWKRSNDKQGRFPHAISDFYATEGMTLREKTMLDFINKISDKSNWQQKIYDDSIVKMWKIEAGATNDDQETNPDHLSVKCFKYCIKELKDKATYLEKHGLVHVLDVEATVVKADVGDSDTLCPALSKAVKPLENVHEQKKDWHPGSDGLVLDLVHPSLFPLQYGKSYVLPTGKINMNDCSKYICEGVQCPIPKELAAEEQYTRLRSWSNKRNLRPWGSYQWLPSDISFREDGTAKIESYVNNLHPKQHQEMYSVLESAVDRAIPLWNECLSWFHTRLRIQIGGCDYQFFKVPDHLEGNHEDGFRVKRVPQQAEGEQSDDADKDGEEDEEGEDEEEDDGYDTDESDALARWIKDNPDQRQVEHPDPNKDYVPFEERVSYHGLSRINLPTEFPSGLQIIFKLANIHLTPEKPTYNGSDWHVEGALNEHICATALIYYDQENIEDSWLEFRQEADSEAMIMKPSQDEWQAAEDLFGIEMEGAAVQDLGKVLTRKGRILAFPNVMQHRIRPFSLKDNTKPGYRKILAMFLVDPHIRVLSTANVPPQQRAWWAEEVRLVEPFAGLPIELFDRIIECVDDFPIGWDQACEMREALMAERGRVNQEFDEVLASDTFYFCEH